MHVNTCSINHGINPLLTRWSMDDPACWTVLVLLLRAACLQLPACESCDSSDASCDCEHARLMLNGRRGG
eukprot:COSAG01_NODE_182_length_22838_cov_34.788733_17_plen_70_part_00